MLCDIEMREANGRAPTTSYRLVLSYSDGAAGDTKVRCHNGNIGGSGRPKR
jgi:hypothetical protein